MLYRLRRIVGILTFQFSQWCLSWLPQVSFKWLWSDIFIFLKFRPWLPLYNLAVENGRKQSKPLCVYVFSFSRFCHQKNLIVSPIPLVLRSVTCYHRLLVLNPCCCKIYNCWVFWNRAASSLTLYFLVRMTRILLLKKWDGQLKLLLVRTPCLRSPRQMMVSATH